MNFKIFTLSSFDKELKRLCKKYPSLKYEFNEFVKNLVDNPQQGTSLGLGCFKIRIGIKSKNAGKSRGGRIITFVEITDEEIYLLTIYDKSESSSISDAELRKLIEQVENQDSK